MTQTPEGANLGAAGEPEVTFRHLKFHDSANQHDLAVPAAVEDSRVEVYHGSSSSGEAFLGATLLDMEKSDLEHCSRETKLTLLIGRLSSELSAIRLAKSHEANDG